MKAGIKHRIKCYLYLNGFKEFVEYGFDPVSAFSDLEDWHWLDYNKQDPVFYRALTLYKGIPCMGAVYLWDSEMHSVWWVYEL